MSAPDEVKAWSFWIQFQMEMPRTGDRQWVTYAKTTREKAVSDLKLCAEEPAENGNLNIHGWRVIERVTTTVDIAIHEHGSVK